MNKTNKTKLPIAKIKYQRNSIIIQGSYYKSIYSPGAKKGGIYMKKIVIVIVVAGMSVGLTLGIGISANGKITTVSAVVCGGKEPASKSQSVEEKQTEALIKSVIKNDYSYAEHKIEVENIRRGQISNEVTSIGFINSGIYDIINYPLEAWSL
jgi:hypothetical protein